MSPFLAPFLASLQSDWSLRFTRFLGNLCVMKMCRNTNGGSYLGRTEVGAPVHLIEDGNFIPVLRRLDQSSGTHTWVRGSTTVHEAFAIGTPDLSPTFDRLPDPLPCRTAARKIILIAPYSAGQLSTILNQPLSNLHNTLRPTHNFRHSLQGFLWKIREHGKDRY